MGARNTAVMGAVFLGLGFLLWPVRGSLSAQLAGPAQTQRASDELEWNDSLARDAISGAEGGEAVSQPTPLGSSPDDVVAEGTDLGQRAPDFTLLDLDGETVRLSNLRGHNVLINFWASYCPFCRHEMPVFETIHQERQDLVVLGINIGEDAQSIRSFVSEVGALYPILLDKTGGVTTAFGVVSLPATFLLDERGVVVWKKFGTTSEEELVDQLQAFKER